MNKQSFLDLIAPYEAIIFDFGGVLFNIDYSKTQNALNELAGKENAAPCFSKTEQAEIFDLFETGKISDADFLARLRDLLKAPQASEEQLRAAWNAMLLDLPVDRVKLLEEIRQTKQLFLLSNINAIHEEFVEQYLEQNGLGSFYTLFDQYFFSHHIGLRKPDRRVFEFVLNQIKSAKEKCFFIDDSPQHVETAKDLGIPAYYLQAANSLLGNGMTRP